jgi:flagellar hook-associated protein 2
VSGTIKAARDVGLSLDRTGRMVLNETTLDLALANSYSDVTQMFTAGTNNKSLFSPAAAGLAGDAVVTLDKMLRSTGSIAKQTDSATKDLAKYKADLEKLEERMSKAFDRYIEQFSIMESMVGSANSLRENMKSSFEGMMAAYTNK